MERPDLGERSVDCSQVLEQLADYLDEESRQELCRAIEQHLAQCRNCSVEVDTVKKTIMLYQADRRIEAPRSVTVQLEAALAREYIRAQEKVSTD